MRSRQVRIVGVVPRDIVVWHPLIDRLLKEDDKRREKQLADPFRMSLDDPRLDTPRERRRLRVLNSFLVAVSKFNCKAVPSDREGNRIYLSFYGQRVIIALEPSQPSGRNTSATAGTKVSSKPRLSLSIVEHSGSGKERTKWQDDNNGGLETHMTEIAIQVVLTAEVQYREGVIRKYEWRVARKAELEEEESKRKLEAERAESERLTRLEQAKIDSLLKDAAALDQARQVRDYVAAIRLAQCTSATFSNEDLERWCQWASAQADRIDPTMRGAFLSAMKEEHDTKQEN